MRGGESMIKLFFKKFFIAISAILFIFLCGIVGLGILFFILWLFSISKWLAVPAIIIIMALVYAGVETYEERTIQRKQSIAIEIEMLKEEQKKLHDAAVAETNYEKALEYCEQIDKIEDKIKKLEKQMEK